jgi:uncharacterized protein (TIGR00255 family)
MLHSMTGFGEAQREAKGISFQVEIKALNNRFLKTSIKLPDVLSFAEPKVQLIIREHLCRGSITYILHIRSVSAAGTFEVNHGVVQDYMRHLEQIRTLRGQEAVHIDLAGILQLPGACQLREYSDEDHEFFLDIIKELTCQGLEKLRQMRIEEGKSILVDLKKNCQEIKQNLEALAKLSGKAVNRYRDRVERRVNELLAGVNLKLDEESLIKEVAIFAERSDINEEISRLQSHLDQFNEICESDEQAGRQLEFLTQEMLREANTIGSKSNDAGISHYVVGIKVAIDRLKEQVQNVE